MATLRSYSNELLHHIADALDGGPGDSALSNHVGDCIATSGRIDTMRYERVSSSSLCFDTLLHYAGWRPKRAAQAQVMDAQNPVRTDVKESWIPYSLSGPFDVGRFRAFSLRAVDQPRRLSSSRLFVSKDAAREELERYTMVGGRDSWNIRSQDDQWAGRLPPSTC